MSDNYFDKLSRSNSQEPSVYGLLRRYAFPLWKEIIFLVLLSLVTTFFTTLQPLFISGLLETVVAEGNLSEIDGVDPELPGSFLDLNTLGRKMNYYINEGVYNFEGDKLQQVLTIILLFLVVSLLASAFGYASQVTSSWVRVSSIRLIRNDFAKHIISLDITFFNDIKSAELVSRFNQDASNTAIGLGPLLHGFIQHGVLIIVYSSYLFSTDETLAYGVVVIGILHWAITRVVKKPVRERERNYYNKLANLVSSFQEVLISMRAIKSFGVEKFFYEKTSQDIDVMKNAEFRSSLIRQLEPNLRLFIDNLAIAGIFFLGAVHLQTGDLTLQGFLMFLLVGKLLITPLNKFSVNFVWIQGLLASYDRLFEIFKIENLVKSGEGRLSHLNNKIEFKDVSFSYGYKNVLDSLSFELNKGEVVAVVGPSGAGKSTLIDLILRLYDPKSGAILIDGVDIRRVSIEDYKSLFGVVSQESFLINDTVTNNICFGAKKCDQSHVENVARIANADGFIDSLPNGYNTVLGDRGVKLSGGQRQRISIARAIYPNPEIIVFDEATSSLDSESEDKVHVAIENVLSNATALVVAHRLSTIIQADKIIVINNGKIEAIGKHKTLLEQCKTYRKLYNLQFKEARSQAAMESAREVS